MIRFASALSNAFGGVCVGWFECLVGWLGGLVLDLAYCLVIWMVGVFVFRIWIGIR